MSEDPTSRFDREASAFRRWYEANRVPWWRRLTARSRGRAETADEFSLAALSEARRILKEDDDAQGQRPDEPRLPRPRAGGDGSGSEGTAARGS